MLFQRTCIVLSCITGVIAQNGTSTSNSTSSGNTTIPITGSLKIVINNPLAGVTYPGNVSLPLNATYTNDSPVSFAMTLTLNQPDGLAIPLGGPSLPPVQGSAPLLRTLPGDPNPQLFDLRGPTSGAYNLSAIVQYFSGVNSDSTMFSLNWNVVDYDLASAATTTIAPSGTNTALTFTYSPTGNALDFGGGSALPSANLSNGTTNTSGADSTSPQVKMWISTAIVGLFVGSVGVFFA